MQNADPWAEYARISIQANALRLSDRTAGAEEALNAILTAIEQGVPKTAVEFDILAANRAGKHRRRRRILEANTHLLASTVSDLARIEARFELARVRRVSTQRDWRLLCAIGAGNTFSRIAATEGVPEATVKTWVRRARLKLAA
jgi:DNA-binding NarL/FixJ family response regulator